jgi:uncharacterized protein (TIGR00290 family)
VSSREKAIVSWSSGKDSAFALHAARRDFDVVAILTTVTGVYERVSMHGVREVLLERQAAALGLPCWKVRLPVPCSNEVYECEMARALEAARAQGVTRVVFGDLFLEDIRAYREARLAGTGLSPVFPLWGSGTDALAREMLAAGMEATLTCVDPRVLGGGFAGRKWDAALLEALPAGVDPCGERGEFHTFVSAGPMFTHPIPVTNGEVVLRDGFVFADLLPA